MLKRLFDLTLSMVAMAVLSPVLFGIACAIKLTSPGPIFFRQRRIGKGGSHFNILKFRTMRINAPQDVPTHQLSQAGNFITPLGNILRRTSLDELPQLINIFRGEMSFIGPRPALWNQDDLIAERDRYGANDVLPGLSGWAQINGRDELPVEIKARLDGEYVEKQSFWFDIRCILGTFFTVFRQSGIVEGGTGVMESAKHSEHRPNQKNAA